jgi:hypothetical protein
MALDTRFPAGMTSYRVQQRDRSYNHHGTSYPLGFILKRAVAMPGKPFVLMYRSMNGFPGIHPLGDRSKIPLTLLYIRANGIFDHATAL